MAIDPISAGIAGFSAFSNLIGGFQSKKMQKRALAQQQRQFEDQMAFNNDWNIINYKNENRWRQYDYDWNTMKAQRQRIEEAGMNPALMMGQMSPGFSSSQAAGTGSFGAPNAQTPIVADALGQSFSRLAGDVSSVLQSFASAGKMDMETKEIRDTLFQKVRGQMLENDQRELALSLDRMYAATERYQGIRHQVADYAKTVAEKVAAYAQGRYFDESALNQMEQSMLNAAKRKMSEEEYRQFVALFPIVKQREQEAVKLIQQQQKTEQSKQVANYSTVALNNASAREKDELARQMNILNKYLDKRQQRELKHMSIDKKLRILDGMVKNGFVTISGSSSASAGGNFGLSGGKGNGKGGLNLGLGLDKSSSVSGSKTENVYRNKVQQLYEQLLDDVDIDGEVQYQK